MNNEYHILTYFIRQVCVRSHFVIVFIFIHRYLAYLVCLCTTYYILHIGWHDYSEMLKNMLQNLLVVPMGTQTYDKKFERARTPPQLAIGHSIFSTIA